MTLFFTWLDCVVRQNLPRVLITRTGTSYCSLTPRRNVLGLIRHVWNCKDILDFRCFSYTIYNI